MIDLPGQIRVLERGWLSSNNILFIEGEYATLAAAFGCRIAIPAGIVPAVMEWDEAALLREPTVQSSATRFAHDDVVTAGDKLTMGGLAWRATP